MLDKYYKKLVVTLPLDTNGNKIVQTLIENNVGSVVVIDKNRAKVAENVFALQEEEEFDLG